MGRRLQAKVRLGLRRLPEPEADPEGLVRVLPKGHRDERDESARQDGGPGEPGHADVMANPKAITAVAHVVRVCAFGPALDDDLGVEPSSMSMAWRSCGPGGAA